MGTPLTGSSVASTYTALLKTTDNAVLSGSLRTISDGGGNDSALQISTAGVASTGTLAVTGATNLSSLTTSGNVSIGGALSVTGNLSVPGTLSSTGDFSVNTNKFNVTASSGNTSVAGTLGVTGATSLSSLSTSGAATVGTTLGVTGNFAVNTNKFTVAAASGNTVVAGTLNVTGASVLGSLSSGTLTVSGLSQVAELDALSDTTVGGTFDVSGATTLASLTANGNATLNGDLAVNGNTTIGNASGDSLTVTAGTVAINNLTSKATPVDADTVLLRDSAASNALKTSTVSSLNTIKFIYSEGFSKTGGGGQSASITTGSATAIQEGGSTSDWTYTWTPKTVGNKAIIRVSVPIEVGVQGSMYIGVAKSPYSAPNDYIGVGAAFVSASASSPANVVADMVFTSTAASHTFKIFVTGATQTVVIARNSFGYYFGQTGTTLQGKVQFELIEYA